MNDRRIYAWCSLLFCVLALAGCARQTAAPSSPQTVDVVTAAIRSVHPTVTLAGIIAPLQNVTLTSDLQEYADVVYVNEGDAVHRGQVLARLNTADLNANAAQAQAHLEQARYQANLAIGQGGDQVRAGQAALGQSNENLALSRSNLARDEQLLASGFISVQAVDQQRTQVRVNEQAVVAAQAALAQAKENAQANGTPNRGLQQANVDQAAAALSQVQTELAKAAIASPVDGVVVNRNLNPGEYPGTRQIFTLQEVSHVYADLSAFGSQISGIREGAAATLTSPAAPKHTFGGHVVAILSPTTPTSSGFTIKVEVPNRDLALRPGMTVSGTITAPVQGGIAIPVAAFLDDTHQTIMAIDGDTARITHVNEIAEDGRYAIVTGLRTGAKVVANGQTSVVDGQKVAVR